MNRTRLMAAVVVVAVVAAGGVAVAVSDGGDPVATDVTTTSSTTTEAPTTTAAPTTTSTTAPTTTTAPPDDGALRVGDKGPAVLAVQERLTELKFDPGPADGAFGQATAYAVQGFQKLSGMRADGVVGPEVAAALAAPAAVTPLVPDGGPDRVEVDLPRQLLFLYKGGELRLVSHVSTGNNETYCVEGSCNNKAITPIGAFKFSWRYKGWRQSRLGKLYNPVYFTSSGVAIHGALSVPLYPASHGCVRIPMHIAGYFPSLVRSGDPVYVTDGRPLGPPKAPTGPPPADPPTTPDDEPTTTTTAPPTTTTSTTVPPTTTTTAPPTTTTTRPTTTTTASLLP